MFSRKNSQRFLALGSVATVMLTGAPAIQGQAATATCQTIASGIVNNAGGMDLIADVPFRGTEISKQEFSRAPTPPGGLATLWGECNSGVVCNQAIFGTPTKRVDAQDNTTTWTVHVQATCTNDGSYLHCSTVYVRLVLTYSMVPTTNQCLSQATFPIGSGQDFTITLFAPPPAKNMTWSGFMRELATGPQWAFCDGPNLEGNHFCAQKSLFLAQANLPDDQSDHDPGMAFVCSNHFTKITGYADGNPIYTTYNGPARWCRAVVYYTPNP
jgi:hypothetical protein